MTLADVLREEGKEEGKKRRNKGRSTRNAEKRIKYTLCGGSHSYGCERGQKT